MAMTYTSLIANKGVSGSIANWVNYTRLDLPAIVDEAQALIFTFLRVREMMSQYVFNIPLFGASIPLPANFAEAIGRMFIPSINYDVMHKDSAFIMAIRNYTESNGTLLVDPFTTTINATTVGVSLAGHGFNQESVFNTAGATLFNGVTIVGTFPISAIVDANNFTIDISVLGAVPTGSGQGGGSAVTYLCDNLQATTPQYYAIWDEAIHFDGAFPQAYNMQMQYYKRPPLLSSTNQSNFLTNRYPHLMRTACQAAAADFMKDDTEYQKSVARLQGYIQTIMAENDLQYRGMELDTEVP